MNVPFRIWKPFFNLGLDLLSLGDIHFLQVDNIGVTAGASAPEVLVQQVIEKLKSLGAEAATEAEGEAENITFTLPKELKS